MAKHKATDYLGRGLYTITEAARLLRMHPNKLKGWTGDRNGAAAVIHREFPDEGILTFAEFVELYLIKLFLDEGVSLATIRRAASEAARKFHTHHPFAVKRFDTDGKRVFATLIGRESATSLVEELRHGQLVFSTIIRPFFRKIKYHGHEVSQFWPLDESGRIVLDPMRRYGAPIDAETGMPVETIIDALNAGGGQDTQTVAEWLGIPQEAVQAAVQFERSLAA